MIFQRNLKRIWKQNRQKDKIPKEDNIPVEVKIGVVDLRLVLIFTAVSCGNVVEGLNVENTKLILHEKLILKKNFHLLRFLMLTLLL